MEGDFVDPVLHLLRVQREEKELRAIGAPEPEDILLLRVVLGFLALGVENRDGGGRSFALGEVFDVLEEAQQLSAEYWKTRVILRNNEKFKKSFSLFTSVVLFPGPHSSLLAATLELVLSLENALNFDRRQSVHIFNLLVFPKALGTPPRRETRRPFGLFGVDLHALRSFDVRRC